MKKIPCSVHVEPMLDGEGARVVLKIGKEPKAVRLVTPWMGFEHAVEEADLVRSALPSIPTGEDK